MLSFDAACDVAAAVLNSEFATNLQGQANIKILANLLYDETARQQGVRHGPMILQSCTPALTRHMIVVLLQTLDSLDCNVENTIFVVPNQQVAQEWRMILRKISAFGARKRASGDAPRVQIQTHKGACDQLLRWKGLNLRLIIDLMSLERQSREARMVKQLQTLTGINRMYFLTPVISLMTRHRTLLMDHIMHVHGQSHMSASHVSPETRFHYYHCTIPCTSKCMSTSGPVYSICTHQPKSIWALNAVNCEPVVACGSEWGRHFDAVRQFAVWHNSFSTCTWPGCATVSVASKAIHFSMYFAECFVFQNFRLFLHRCEPHVQPWLFDMLLATVCMSTYGPVYSISKKKSLPCLSWMA